MYDLTKKDDYTFECSGRVWSFNRRFVGLTFKDRFEVSNGYDSVDYEPEWVIDEDDYDNYLSLPELEEISRLMMSRWDDFNLHIRTLMVRKQKDGK